MKDLLVIKYSKRDCSIANKFFRCFITNFYIIFLSNEEFEDVEDAKRLGGGSESC
jgi:hypothetical protein